MKKICIMIIISLLLPTSFAISDEPSSWAKDYIVELQAYNEIKGDMFNGYKDDITRLEFIYLSVKMIEIVKGEPVTIDSNIMFTDTQDTYALKGASIGITSGIGNNQFGPHMFLTREQMATLLLNTLTILEMDTLIDSSYKFTDEDEFSSWAKDAIYKIKANDIMNGVGNDRFDAKSKTTKEAAMVVVTKLIRKNIHKLDSAYINSMVKENLNQTIKVNKDIQVVMKEIETISKPSLNSTSFTYSQKNISDMSLPEASLRVFFSDGSSQLIKGFSRYIEPGSTKTRTLSIDYEKYQTPLFVIIDTDIIDINLNLKTMAKWLIN